MIKYLIENGGADKIVNNSIGSSPLNILCKIKSNSDSIHSIDYLINEGTDVNDKDENGISPLLTACYFNNKKVLEHLIENHTADININIRNNYGDSALITLGYFNNEDFIKYLIDHKANTYLRNKNGDTLLNVVKSIKNRNIEEYLKNKNIGNYYIL